MPHGVESADGTVVHDTHDPAIVDAFGDVYALAPFGIVLINGKQDMNAPVVQMLAYSGRAVWGKDVRDNWHSKKRGHGSWFSGRSPLVLQRLDEIQQELGELMLLMESNQSTLAIALANVADTLTEMNLTLQKILQGVNNSVASKIELDIRNATVVAQPVPGNPGP